MADKLSGEDAAAMVDLLSRTERVSGIRCHDLCMQAVGGSLSQQTIMLSGPLLNCLAKSVQQFSKLCWELRVKSAESVVSTGFCTDSRAEAKP